MTATSTARPVPHTVSSFLFGTQADATARLARVVADSGEVERLRRRLGPLTARAHTVAGERIATAAATLADLDIGMVAIRGWKTHEALVAAADASLDGSGREVVVDLAEHTIESVHEPKVAVLVDEVEIGTLPLEIRLSLVVRGLVATVRLGRLVAVDSGRCRLRATVSCHGVELASRDAELDHRIRYRFTKGIDLLGDPAQR
jgi:hypothetical protein